ncbi:MAG: hypothetical protein ACOVQL_08185, partial [Limnohabitans sp.]
MKMPTDNAKPVAGRAQGPFATRLTGLLGCIGAAMLVASLWPASAHAQSVFRCGQSYTNAPPPGQLCELMPELAVTRIEGTRVHPGKPPVPEPGAPAAARPGRPAPPPPAALDSSSKLHLDIETDRDQLLGRCFDS